MNTNKAIPGVITSRQTVDPEISTVKFERELKQFRAVEPYNRERGVILVRASFPDIVLMFTAARVRPLMTVFAVKINFINYDLEPLSVQFVDPLTEQLLKSDQIGSHMLRRAKDAKQVVPADGQQQVIAGLSKLIQWHQPDNIPFLCLPGVREYHQHPAHSNDPWLAHRNLGEGTLGFLVDQLHKYGSDVVNGFCPQGFNLNQAAPDILQVQPHGLMFTVDSNRIPI